MIAGQHPQAVQHGDLRAGDDLARLDDVAPLQIDDRLHGIDGLLAVGFGGRFVQQHVGLHHGGSHAAAQIDQLRGVGLARRQLALQLADRLVLAALRDLRREQLVHDGDHVAFKRVKIVVRKAADQRDVLGGQIGAQQHLPRAGERGRVHGAVRSQIPAADLIERVEIALQALQHRRLNRLVQRIVDRHGRHGLVDHLLRGYAVHNVLAGRYGDRRHLSGHQIISLRRKHRKEHGQKRRVGRQPDQRDQKPAAPPAPKALTYFHHGLSSLPAIFALLIVLFVCLDDGLNQLVTHDVAVAQAHHADVLHAL